MTLTTHHLTLTVIATTPVALDEHSGSAIRGAIANALWTRFCTNQAAPTRAACPHAADWTVRLAEPAQSRRRQGSRCATESQPALRYSLHSSAIRGREESRSGAPERGQFYHRSPRLVGCSSGGIH